MTLLWRRDWPSLIDNEVILGFSSAKSTSSPPELLEPFSVNLVANEPSLDRRLYPQAYLFPFGHP